jgi:hypothetical protein
VLAAFNTHEVEGTGGQDVVGLSGLAAGSYIFTWVVLNNPTNANDQSELVCSGSLNGTIVSGFKIPKFQNGIDTFAATVPNGGLFIVNCIANDTAIIGSAKGLAIGRVTALQVGGIN